MTPKRHADRLKTPTPGETKISFDKSVSRDCADLYNTLEDYRNFDFDTLAHMKSLAKEGQTFELPIAFAMLTKIFQVVSAHATRTNNKELLADLDKLYSDLSGFGASREPIKLHTERSLDRPPGH